MLIAGGANCMLVKARFYRSVDLFLNYLDISYFRFCFCFFLLYLVGVFVVVVPGTTHMFVRLVELM